MYRSDDFHYIRFYKRNGKNIDVARTFRTAPDVYNGLLGMGKMAWGDLIYSLRHNEYTPMFYRLWRGEDTADNAWAYIDTDPLDKPPFKFRVDSRLILLHHPIKKGKHTVRFEGFVGKPKYQRMLRNMDNRAWRTFGIDYRKKPETPRHVESELELSKRLGLSW